MATFSGLHSFGGPNAFSMPLALDITHSDLESSHSALT